MDITKKELDTMRTRRSKADINLIFHWLVNDGEVKVVEARDWRNLEVPSIPADDPIFTEGVIITTPIRPKE